MVHLNVVYLRHILDAIQRIEENVQGMVENEFIKII